MAHLLAPLIDGMKGNEEFRVSPRCSGPSLLGGNLLSLRRLSLRFRVHIISYERLRAFAEREAAAAGGLFFNFDFDVRAAATEHRLYHVG